jgi:hypothetical protein
LNWFGQSVLIENFLRGIDFINPNFGMAVGDAGQAVLTTNGGNNWIPLSTNINTSLYKIKLFNNNVAYITGMNGTFLKTSNGGANWGKSFVNTDNTLYSLYFNDINSGYIVGASGTILRTTNGGNLTFLNNSVANINSFYLYQNFPNPFNPTTNIEFSLPEKSMVKLKVFDITGKLITELVNENLSAGKFRYDFYGGDLSSGLYFYKLETEKFSQTKRMILIK